MFDLICPVQSGETSDIKCTANCAWWDEEDEQCAVLTIATYLATKKVS